MGRKTISLSASASRQASELINLGLADGLSELIVKLIRDEADKRGLIGKIIESHQTGMPIREESATYNVNSSQKCIPGTSKVSPDHDAGVHDAAGKILKEGYIVPQEDPKPGVPESSSDSRTNSRKSKPKTP